MLDVFEEVGQGHYEKPSIKGNSKSGQRQWETLRLTVKNGLPVATGKKQIAKKKNALQIEFSHCKTKFYS
jgi:hypothetical protein